MGSESTKGHRIRGGHGGSCRATETEDCFADLSLAPIRMRRPTWETAVEARPAPSRPAPQSIFSIYDDDRSGTLDEEEFSHALGVLGFDMDEAASMFREIDRDGSGEISFEEFEQVGHGRGRAGVAGLLAARCAEIG